jgi:hypothetical protein
MLLTPTRRELGAGPDGKLLVTLRPVPGGGALPCYAAAPSLREGPVAPRPRRRVPRTTVALAIVDTGFVRDALVTFVWAPRDRRPSHIEIVVDGRTLPAYDVARWMRRFDPSLQATWEELELARVVRAQSRDRRSS